MNTITTIWENIHSSTQDMSFVQKSIIAVVLGFIALASTTAVVLLVQSLYNQIFA